MNPVAPPFFPLLGRRAIEIIGPVSVITKMTTQNSKDASLTAGQPAHYRIRVAGALGPDWSDRVNGMFITASGRVGEPSTTILEGDLRDQGALIGVLNTLYEMHLPLLSVESSQRTSATENVEN